MQNCLVKNCLQNVELMFTFSHCRWYALHQGPFGGLLVGALLKLAKSPPAGRRSVMRVTKAVNADADSNFLTGKHLPH